MSPLLVLQNLAHNSTATLAVVKVILKKNSSYNISQDEACVEQMSHLPKVIAISYPVLM